MRAKKNREWKEKKRKEKKRRKKEKGNEEKVKEKENGRFIKKNNRRKMAIWN